METKIYEYIVFLCKSLFFYCFIIFQIPLLFFIFIYFKQPTFQYMIEKRKLWILFCLIVGCLFSSPDLLSLLIISVPLLLFFEMFIFFIILKYNYKNVSSLFQRVAWTVKGKFAKLRPIITMMEQVQLLYSLYY